MTPCDTALVARLFLLVEPRKKSRDNPRKDLWTMLGEFRSRKVHILETDTGRTSKDCDQLLAMLADAVEALTYGNRALPSEQAAKNARGRLRSSGHSENALCQERDTHLGKLPACSRMKLHGAPTPFHKIR